VVLVAWHVDCQLPPQALRIGAGARLHSALASALQRGWIDPDGAGVPALIAARATAANAAPWGTGVHVLVRQPAVCRETIRLVRAATSGWAPASHWLHHTAVRTAVHTVLLVTERLVRIADAGMSRTDVSSPRESGISGETEVEPADANASMPMWLPELPPELWCVVLGFILREDWNVSQTPSGFRIG
jgi:hypothetical protein